MLCCLLLSFALGDNPTPPAESADPDKRPGDTSPVGIWCLIGHGTGDPSRGVGGFYKPIPLPSMRDHFLEITDREIAYTSFDRERYTIDRRTYTPNLRLAKSGTRFSFKLDRDSEGELLYWWLWHDGKDRINDRGALNVYRRVR
jgi:hypothetical protein